MIFSRASLKRSPRIRTRKNSTSVDLDIEPSGSSTLARRKTRPPPLQIIPELSAVLDISPETARPIQSTPQESEPVHSLSRITLSAYAFSIDDALLMLGSDIPRSPALSASSSTSDGASSEDPLATPGTSDDEDLSDFLLPTPRFRPQRMSIRPLCITKTRSLICQEDEHVEDCLEREDKVIPLSVTDTFEHSAEAKATLEEEADQDFYAHEFEDFISFSPTVPAPAYPARRDSLILVADTLPSAVPVLESKPRGRSRHSKPLPLLPPATPPASTFPGVPNLPLVQTTGQKSMVRRKRNMTAPPLLPALSRPLPRMSLPLDIEDCIFLEEDTDIPSYKPILAKHVFDVEDDAIIYSQSSFTYTASTHVRPPPPAIPVAPLCETYGGRLPRSSTDSDAPRSSVDSDLSFTSSASSNAPGSPFSLPESPCSDERLCSRWSTSTLGSLAVESPRGPTLFSPLRNVFGSRARRVFPPPKKLPAHLTPPRHSKSKDNSASPPLVRRHGSQSSTSSAGTSSSDHDSCDGSPSGLKRKPTPVAMFLRAG